MKITKPHFILETYITTSVYTRIEKAGRTAYKSEGKITPGSAEKFIQSIIKRGHESVLEHENITVRFICDRGFTHELVRHRLVSYTQESTRYCNYGGGNMTLIKPCFWEEGSSEYELWFDAMETAEGIYNTLIHSGATPQEARSVLPNSLKTEIVVTANIREWRHILRLRTAKAAHPQMRELMVPLLNEFKMRIPILFEDITMEE